MDFGTISRQRLPELLRAMPKAELHIHIEGSLEPELIFALARKNGVALAWPSVEALRAAYAFTDLQSFLDIYYAGASVLLHESDFEAMAMAYFCRVAADHVVHAEIFFDPQTHTARGVAMGTVIRGLARACERAKRELGVTSALILCFLRHLSEEEAIATLHDALSYREHFIGVGLDSSERGHPPENSRCGNVHPPRFGRRSSTARLDPSIHSFAMRCHTCLQSWLRQPTPLHQPPGGRCHPPPRRPRPRGR